MLLLQLGEASCRHVWPCAGNGWSKRWVGSWAACRGAFIQPVFPDSLAGLGHFPSLFTLYPQ